MPFLPLFKFNVEPQEGNARRSYDIRSVLAAANGGVALMPDADRRYVVAGDSVTALQAYASKYFVELAGMWINPLHITWAELWASKRMYAGHGPVYKEYFPCYRKDYEKLVDAVGMATIGENSSVNLSRVCVCNTTGWYLDLPRDRRHYDNVHRSRLDRHAQEVGWIRYSDGWINLEEIRVLADGAIHFSPKVSVPLDAIAKEGVDRIVAMDWVEVDPNKKVNVSAITHVGRDATKPRQCVLQLGYEMTVVFPDERLHEVGRRLAARRESAPRDGG